MHSFSSRPLRWLLVISTIALGACSDARDFEPQSFTSDLPTRLRDRAELPSAGDGDGDVNAPSDDPSRAIAEADIVQVAEGRLYALSRYGGLHVIDVSEPSALTSLGRFASAHDAQPFEMYLRDGVAFVMYTAWGQYERNATDDGYVWVQSSKVLAIDVSDPASMTELASFTIPGAISDSRIVGDVLYVVGYQDGYCWACEQGQPLTSIVSLDISDPSDVRKVDELAYEDDDNAWGGNRRSIHVTEQRMYVAGIEYGDDGPVGSTIQVIDISDPDGALVEAAAIEAEGQITSRWQMDEHDGVLRVLSQPPAWDLQQPPVVQTFAITSSDQLDPLGRAELVLPRPEQLQSVRFDGARAYAITFQRTDPLFTIDLSDPAHPVQRGELEMPGFIYYMEPRGERVIGLGYDQGNAAGAVTVSVFDVSDLASPVMVSRVNFGGSWASLPEDQDRIHKAFRVLDALGLILVPHSGWSEVSCGGSSSGIQLMDYDAEAGTLALRGAVQVLGEARRGLVIEDRLLTVSDERVDSYDLADRDRPQLTSSAALTRDVTRTVPLQSGAIARISEDFWRSNSLRVDFVEGADVADPQSASNELELGALLRPDGTSCNAYVWLQDAFAIGDTLAIVYRSERWDDVESKGRAGLLLIDAADPDAAAVLSNTDWRFDYGFWWFDGFYDYGVPATRSAIAHTDDAVVMLESSYSDGAATRWLRVIDIRDAQAPAMSTLDLTAHPGQGGLLAEGDMIISSHYEAARNSESVRFFIDRFNVTDPSAPVALPSINVPGTVLAFDRLTHRAITADLIQVGSDRMSWDACSERYATFELDYDSGDPSDALCTGYRQRLNLLRVEGASAELLDSYELDDDQALRSSALGQDALFATIGRGAYRGWLAVADCWGPCGYYPSEPSTFIALSGISGSAFETATLEIDDDAWWGWWSPTPIYAIGQHVLVVGQDDATIIDASDPRALAIDRIEPLGGYVQHVSASDDAAFLSLGVYGARRVEVDRAPE